MTQTKNKNKKLRVGIFYGGPSKEHEVSIKTAKEISKHIDSSKYQHQLVKISKTGQWPKNFRIESLKKHFDFAFIAMHGSYGEDGVIQAIFESQNIPYSGSGVSSSSLAMNKQLSQIIAKSLGVDTPQTWVINEALSKIKSAPDHFVIKPNDSGSSDGVILLTKNELLKNIELFKKKYRNYLLQERIFGRELTIPILDQQVLPTIEIISQNKIYDYEAKYVVGMSKHVLNPKLPQSVHTKLSDAALSIHNLLGCRVMSRSDFLLSGNKLYYLETNTLPGMTSTSLFPESAASVGIGFTQLIDKIIKLSLE